MTQEDKELLLKDLSARLPYGVKVKSSRRRHVITLSLDVMTDFHLGCSIKPYLRPMSSMTREERCELQEILGKDVEIPDDFLHIVDSSRKRFSFLELQAVFDWLLKNHFDFRGLIPMGLAIEATEEDNPYK